MSRQTAFPGVIVDEIEASTGGSGRSLEFQEGLPENIPTKRIESLLENIPLFGSKWASDSKIVYRLQVASAAKPGAHLKARAFARAKNPFEPRLVEVKNVTKLDDMGVMSMRNAYSVEVVVTK